ncbi:HAUS6_N domain-containing protein [Caerostris darwini]|uniref:HAUS6_N domain-containing protein n=1 Tax=Caerostris darwini TaxID=1538125 RepID=A0AAV4SA13_9ARAC|nr:HAUS6_N domain-containing protein [Caerostris darwini]
MSLDRELTNHKGTKKQGESYFKHQGLDRECNIFLSTKKSRNDNDWNSRGLNVIKNKSFAETKSRFQNLWYNKMASNVFLSELEFQAKELQRRLIAVCQRGGMTLHRWFGDHPELSLNRKECDFAKPNEMKTLGVYWSLIEDYFSFKMKSQFETMDVYTKQRQIFFNNLLILEFDIAAVEKEYRVKCDKDMFCLPNQKLFEIVIYFLFEKLTEVTEEKYILPWPLLDKDQHRLFQKTCVNYLSSIALKSNIRFPRIVPSVLSTFSGERFYEMLLAFSTHVVEKTIIYNDNVSLISQPSISECNGQDAIEILKISTILSIEKVKEMQQFSHSNMEHLIKTANIFMDYIQKLKSNLAANLSLQEEKIRILTSLFCEEDNVNKSLLENSMKKMLDFAKKVKHHWKLIDEFYIKEKQIWSCLSSVVEKNPETFILDGANLELIVNNSIKEHCPELNAICSSKIEDEKVCLLKYLQIYSILLKFYMNCLLKADLSEIQEQSSVNRTWSFEHSLEDLKALNEKFLTDVIQNIKENNIKLQNELLPKESSEAVQKFSKGCSSWNFTSKSFQEDAAISRLAFPDGIIDENLKTSLFAFNNELKSYLENERPHVFSSEVPTDVQNTLNSETKSFVSLFREALAPLCRNMDYYINQNKSNITNQNLFKEEDFDVKSSSISDMLTDATRKTKKEFASISPTLDTEELVDDHCKFFKMREGMEGFGRLSLEDSLDAETLPENSNLDSFFE